MKSLTHIGIALILSGLFLPCVSNAGSDPRLKKIAPLVTYLYLHTEPNEELEAVVRRLIDLNFTNARVELTLEQLFNWHATRPLPPGKRRHLEMEPFVDMLGNLPWRSAQFMRFLLVFTLFNSTSEVAQLLAYRLDAIVRECPWEAAEILRSGYFMMLRDRLATDRTVFYWRATSWEGTRKTDATRWFDRADFILGRVREWGNYGIRTRPANPAARELEAAVDEVVRQNLFERHSIPLSAAELVVPDEEWEKACPKIIRRRSLAPLRIGGRL